MIGYLDSSALVKRYIDEPGSDQVQLFLAEAEALATVTITRTETTSAFAKAIRVGALDPERAEACRRRADLDWPYLVRLPVTESTVERAATLAWSDNLRAYDAVQLAAACSWQEDLESPVVFASFDAHLWTAARRHHLSVFPPDLPSLLQEWRTG